MVWLYGRGYVIVGWGRRGLLQTLEGCGDPREPHWGTRGGCNALEGLRGNARGRGGGFPSGGRQNWLIRKIPWGGGKEERVPGWK
eukprot:659373-Amorphochlora_amoeboformis.AAC.1